jgi:hypothetical protein
MTNYVVETSLRDSYASIQLSPELAQQAIDDKVTLLLADILSVFPEVDVALTADSYVRVKATLLQVLMRKPLRQERKRKMITEQVRTYNDKFKELTVSFVYAYQVHLLSFKYSVGSDVPNSFLSPRDEEVVYREFQKVMQGRWKSWEKGDEDEFFTSTESNLPKPFARSNEMSDKKWADLKDSWLDYSAGASRVANSLILASDTPTAQKSENQITVETLLDGLEQKERKFKSLKLTTEQEYAVESTMLSCQQISSLISGAQEFASTQQQEAVYEKAIPALKLLDEQFTQLQEELNAGVLRELDIMEDYLNTKHARLSLTKIEE